MKADYLRMPMARFGRTIACTLAAALLAALPAKALTYNIDVDGSKGTFEAPPAGGLVSAFDLTLFGILFDTPDVGATAPNYRLAFNDFRGMVGGTSGVRNATASGGCAALDCALLFEDTFPPGSPPFEWSVLRISTLDNLGFGDPYSISPIPVPAAGWMLGALVVFLAAGSAARRRRRAA